MDSKTVLKRTKATLQLKTNTVTANQLLPQHAKSHKKATHIIPC